MFLFSMLAVFRAPTYHLWMLALVATEWGHWLWAPALLSLAPGWSLTRGGRAGAALGVAAALLLLSPLARARRDFGAPRDVGAELAAAFGGGPAAPRERAAAPARAAPLVFGDLWLGVRSPKVREEAMGYSRRGGEDLLLQLYRPLEAAEPLPLVLVVHGGSWRSGTRLEMPELSRYLAARGYAVASIDYGLAPATRFPGPIEDVRAALVFLRIHAHELSLDPDRVVLLGRSAGSQIVLAAAADRLPGVRGVVDFYGPNDMRLAWAVPGSPRVIDSRALLRDYLGGSPDEFPKLYDEATSLDRADGKFPPTLMIHGSRDELVWPLHELRLSARLASVGVPHYYLELPWATHGCDYVFSGPCGQISTYAVERFLARVVEEKHGS
jgi:acetyl esterase/lipase